MSVLETAIKKIEAQQPKIRNAVWGVGEQLKDLLRAEPELAEIVSQDLDVAAMSLAACEKKIKERADAIHKSGGGNSVFIRPEEAEEIIRHFYGLPPRGETPQPEAKKRGEVIRLDDFF